ncbi:hypothetical protein NL108_015162 [Boleophthalmus pectinirostris]|nr:hypothetical protein NL108_015162 [Boleophthalmus pectinirostris]
MASTASEDTSFNQECGCGLGDDERVWRFDDVSEKLCSDWTRQGGCGFDDVSGRWVSIGLDERVQRFEDFSKWLVLIGPSEVGVASMTSAVDGFRLDQMNGRGFDNVSDRWVLIGPNNGGVASKTSAVDGF